MSGVDAKKATLAAAAAAIFLGMGMAAPADAGVKAGLLECSVSGGYGLIILSHKSLACTFTPTRGKVEHYSGRIGKFGLDIGLTNGSYLAWAVIAPTAGSHKGALVGNYGGLTAEATVGVGVGANALLGGNNNTIMLQPLSVTGQTGLNLAAGVAGLTLAHP